LFSRLLRKGKKEKQNKSAAKKSPRIVLGGVHGQSPSDLTMDEMLLDATFSDALQ
jgi:hypothetical protein